MKRLNYPLAMVVIVAAVSIAFLFVSGCAKTGNAAGGALGNIGEAVRQLGEGAGGLLGGMGGDMQDMSSKQLGNANNNGLVYGVAPSGFPKDAFMYNGYWYVVREGRYIPLGPVQPAPSQLVPQPGGYQQPGQYSPVPAVPSQPAQPLQPNVSPRNSDNGARDL